MLAEYFVEIKYEQEIFDLISTEIFAHHPHFILWWGANILFTKNYRGVLIKISLLGKEIIKEENTSIYVKVGAGENRHETMMRALTQWYVWGENMVLIPGQVWSAPVGNIGAYGSEAKDIIAEVEWIDIETQEKKVRSHDECVFGYRDSIFKHALQDKIIITSVTFVFKKNSSDYIPNIQYKDIQDMLAAIGKDPQHISAQDVADIIITIRKNKLPDRTQIGTAGSFFKNPVIEKKQFDELVITYPELKWNPTTEGIKLSAGQLIELAGYKGKSAWAVATYAKHALVIINTGGASGEEIMNFAQAIQKKVLELFGVMLEPEVILM